MFKRGDRLILSAKGREYFSRNPIHAGILRRGPATFMQYESRYEDKMRFLPIDDWSSYGMWTVEFFEHEGGPW